MGRPLGRARAVTPPIIMPVSSRVSAAEAKDARDTPISPRTRRLTSSRSLPRTMQAEYATAAPLADDDDGVGAVGQVKPVLGAKVGGVAKLRVNANPFPPGNGQIGQSERTFASITSGALISDYPSVSVASERETSSLRWFRPRMRHCALRWP